MKLVEMFNGIQGEGSYMGKPMTFVRTYGCNLHCSWCDTPYSYDVKGEFFEVDFPEFVAKLVTTSHSPRILWTGGEPLLQKGEMIEWIKELPEYTHHLETNGTLLDKKVREAFDHITCSPKDLNDLPDFRLIDDLKLVVKYPYKYTVRTALRKAYEAGFIAEQIWLQPMASTPSEAFCGSIQLWEMAAKLGVSLSPRLHTMLFGSKRGI